MLVGTVRGRVTRPGEFPVHIDTTPLTHEDLGMSKDEAAALVGDGLAEVVVSHDQADKEFGDGSSTFCSVKLTVNQDVESIRQGQELAHMLALGFLPEAREQAREVWGSAVKKDPAPPEPEPERRRGRRGGRRG